MRSNWSGLAPIASKIPFHFLFQIYPVTKQSKSNRIALMINNIKFHNDSSDRHGAEKDDWVMFNLLQSLGYQVVHYNNLTGKVNLY